jgi:hypothetical protein
MPGFTDTATAPTVFLGASNIQDRVFLSVDTGGFTSYTGTIATQIYEIRGLADSTAIASAAYWSAQPNTSAIVTRTSEAGLYNVVRTQQTRILVVS